MATATKKKSIECHMCEKKIAGTTIIKHLWDKHRDHMMENRARGPRKPKTDKVTTAKSPKATKPVGAGNEVLAFILLETLSAKFGKKSPEAAINAIYSQLTPAAA